MNRPMSFIRKMRAKGEKLTGELFLYAYKGLGGVGAVRESMVWEWTSEILNSKEKF